MSAKDVRWVAALIGLVVVALMLAGCDMEAGTTAQSLTPVATATERTSQAVETPTLEPTALLTETAIPVQPATDTATETATTEPPTATPSPTSMETATKTVRSHATSTRIPPTRTPQAKASTPTTAVARATASRTSEVDSGAAPVGTPTASAPDATSEPGGGGGNGRTVNGKWYDAYVPAVTKKKQYYHYTCEFDAAWVVLKSNGIDATLDDQIAIVGLDKSIEPRYEETKNGIFIYGGDIFHSYSGDYTENFLARSTGVSMRRVFEHYGLKVTAVNTREGMEAALRRGELVWIKTTADFKPGKAATWIMPDGTQYETVLGNDHAAVVMGYSERGALIRDVLGPTSTNLKREYEYEVPWPKFLAAWAQQQNDGLAVWR